MSDTGSQSRAARHRTTRLEAFSDGVFAIAITLLVLDIAVPSAPDDLLDALGDQWPSYLAYLVTFASIGAVWFVHTVITEYIHSSTSVFVRLNLLLLMVVTLLPFSTGLVGEHIGETGDDSVATTVYGVNLFVTSVALSLLWRHALSEGLVRDEVASPDVAALTKRLTPGLAGYLLMIAAGIILPIVAMIGYLAIAVFLLVPLGALRRRRRTGHHK